MLAIASAVAFRAATGAGRWPATTATPSLASLPASAQGPISAALGHDQPVYRVAGLQALNPAQHLRASFSKRGVMVASGQARLGIALLGFGDASSLRPLKPVAPAASANRVDYAQGSLREWFSNGPLGLEQGFEVGTRPGGDNGQLSLSLTVSGNLTSRLAHGSALFEGHGVRLRYGGLLASDARGRTLHSWLGLVRGHLLIHVDDRGAVYPLRIDPFIQQGEKLTGDGSLNGEFGDSVAISADGSTALIGSPGDDAGAGAAWVFTHSDSGAWTQQGGKLTGDEAGDEFGSSVALSANGNTALIGAVGDSNHLGAAWVFARSESGEWIQQSGRLTGTQEGVRGYFGFSVALSGDGNTALIGGPGDNEGAGAVWAFTRSESGWTQEGEKLTGSGVSSYRYFGASVALDAGGDTALIGGPGDSATAGAVWAFTRSESNWTQEGEKLVAAGASGNPYFGLSLALSANGTTAVIGGPTDSEGIGAAWVFTRSESTWTQEGEKLTGAGESGKGSFGSSVAISPEGETALIGGPGDAEGTGAAWVFTGSHSTWAQQGEKLIGSGESGAGEFGFRVALSAEGEVAVIGGPGPTRGEGAGAAWVFTSPPESIIPPITPPPSVTQMEKSETPETLLGPLGPVVSDLSETARTWREGDAFAHVSKVAKKALPLGTTISFSLNQAAGVRFLFTKSVGGREVGETCVSQNKQNMKKPRCARTVLAATLKFNAHEGITRVYFDGVLAPHKRLGAGTYTLLVTASASGRRSTPRSLAFTIA